MDVELMKLLSGIEQRIKKTQHARAYSNIMYELAQLADEKVSQDSLEYARICFLTGSIYLREGLATRPVENWRYSSTESLLKAQGYLDNARVIIERLSASGSRNKMTDSAQLALTKNVTLGLKRCRFKLAERQEWVAPSPKLTGQNPSRSSRFSVANIFRTRMTK